MKKTCAAVLAISMAILWVGGCQEEQASPGEKMARLEAVENRELKAQFQKEKAQLQQETKKRDEEIKNLKTKLQTETEKRDADKQKFAEQLAKCEQEKQAMLEKMADEILSQAEKVSEQTILDFANENNGLKADNDRLKKELAACKGKE
jgi:hypothetical protein